jgi:glycosyltransferase involved in cell wall biosynthesis
MANDALPNSNWKGNELRSVGREFKVPFPKTMRVYVDTVRRFCRPKNTDWQYNFILGDLTGYQSDIEFYYPRNPVQEAWVNGRYLFNSARHRLARSSRWLVGLQRERFADRLCSRELAAAECDVVFSHRDFPINAGKLPVVWQNSILDPEMCRARGASEALLEDEFRMKRKLFAQARFVQVSSVAEADRLGNCMPEIRERFRPVPFFLPYLRAIDEDSVSRKHADPEVVEFVFVGREAHRKGLPEVVAALEGIDFGHMENARLTVVSDFRDGPVILPTWPNLRHEVSLPRTEVVELFDRAHVMLMPSRFESYGFVYLEAMSRGVVPVVPNWEVQREIVDQGRCGVVVNTDSGQIADAVVRLLTDGKFRLELALHARQRFVAEYAPATVAQRYADLFRDAAGRAGSA